MYIFLFLYRQIHTHLKHRYYGLFVQKHIVYRKTSVGSKWFVFNKVYCIIIDIQRRHWLLQKLTNKQKNVKNFDPDWLVLLIKINST